MLSPHESGFDNDQDNLDEQDWTADSPQPEATGNSTATPLVLARSPHGGLSAQCPLLLGVAGRTAGDEALKARRRNTVREWPA